MTTTPQFRKEVPGWPGYFVDTLGNVYSNRRGRLKLLKTPLVNGYPTVNFQIEGKRKKFYVHRLVYEVFLGMIPEELEVRHFHDPTKTNCRLENLRVGTRQENSDDVDRHGNRRIGERHADATITDEQALRIRYEEGGTAREVASKYGTTVRVIEKIRFCYTWLHLIDPTRKPYLPASEKARERVQRLHAQ
ncbi:MAG: HNH endonuclease signature motif containing protein [Planctomycetota bacterium]